MNDRDHRLLQQMADLREQAVGALLRDAPTQALEHAEEAIRLSSGLRHRDSVPPLLRERFAGLLYKIGKDLGEAGCLEDATRALECVADIERQIGNLPAVATLLGDLATIFLRAGHPVEAIEIWRVRVLPLHLRLGDPAGRRRVTRNIGIAYARLGDAEACFSCLLESLRSPASALDGEEVEVGLKTALALQEQGLQIPPPRLAEFHALAQAAGLGELEERLAQLLAPREPITLRRTRVFVSYSHADSVQVAALVQFLPEPLFDVGFDRDRLHPGWRWEPRLLDMVREAEVLVVAVGSDTAQRDYVHKEIEVFFASHDTSERGVVPILLDGCARLPPKISAFQAVDLRGQDAMVHARTLANAIHGASHVPHSEIAQESSRIMNATRGRPAEPAPTETRGSGLGEKWKNGEIGASPAVLAQMINLGIAGASVRCAHRELDMTTLQPRRCDAPALIVCTACSTGSCSDGFHTYERFCTLIPPGNPFRPGTKVFYWCSTCRGPLCTRCLGIEDDYPCPPEQLFSFRFECPSCGGHVQIVPVADAGYERVAAEVTRWARAGGPPGSSEIR